MPLKIISSIKEKISPRSEAYKYETGLVLSGGAARGFAHIGVLKALHEKNMEPDIVSGVSAGAIAGGFYSAGYKPEEMLDFFIESSIFKFVKLTFGKRGLFNISGLEKLLRKYLGTQNIEDLEKPLIIAATNIREGKTKYFTTGDLVDSILASCSIPVIFYPKDINGELYVDGGVTNNFPVEPLKNICKNLIGVNANPISGYNPHKGLAHIALQSFHLSIASGIEEKKKLLKYYIEPRELRNYAYYDISANKKMFDAGYRETLKVIGGN
jgi:NTE family protein